MGGNVRNKFLKTSCSDSRPLEPIFFYTVRAVPTVAVRGKLSRILIVVQIITTIVVGVLLLQTIWDLERSNGEMKNDNSTISSHDRNNTRMQRSPTTPHDEDSQRIWIWRLSGSVTERQSERVLCEVTSATTVRRPMCCWYVWLVVVVNSQHKQFRRQRVLPGS